MRPVIGVSFLLALAAFSIAQGSKSKTSPGPTASFGGPPYKVGPVITPTSTTPEAEEVIAADPNNPANMVGTITDYSIRNVQEGTTKYVVSNNGGVSWTQSFVPLSGIFERPSRNLAPASAGGHLCVSGDAALGGADTGELPARVHQYNFAESFLGG